MASNYLYSRVLFMDGEFAVPGPKTKTWPDAALIEFIDRYEAEMATVPEDAILPWNAVSDLFFAAWLELHARTAP